MEFDIVGLGGNVVDCLIRLEGAYFSSRGGDEPPEEKPIVEWTIQGGGKVPSAMAAAGRLRAKATMLTTVGNDEWGEFVISDFQRYGVDTSHINVNSDINTGVTFILIGDHGSNRWVHGHMIADWNLPGEIRRAVAWRETHPWQPSVEGRRLLFSEEELEPLIEGKILNVSSFPAEGSLEAARIAKRKGIPVCYDMYHHPHLAELLQYVTYAIPPYGEAVEFTGETDPEAICKKLITYGPKVAGVTIGEKGSVFSTAEETVVRKAFKVPVVDTTGAGDVFHGAFSFAVIQGWDLAKVVEFSSAVSALKCTKLGGRAGIPTLAEVEAFLEERVEEIR